jgi:enediyne biosynthesis protein E5
MSATAPALSTPAVGAAPKKKPNPRMGLRTSATFATIFTILGHTVFGFEQSWAQVFVALISGYSCAFLFEWVDALANNRAPEFRGGGIAKVVDFLLAPHMTSITLSFLIFVNQRLWIMAFACALAIGSKYVLRVRQNGRLRHFMNPSNFAIAVILVTYQWTGMLPWMYTADLHGAWDWLVPLIIVMLGVRLNILFTGRVPTILSWLSTFVLLAAVRAWIFGYPFPGQLVVLTGIPMVLFTLYMITDPQTSPSQLRSQILFGSGIAFAYSVLLALHVQYTMFYSVTAICTIRGLWLFALNLREKFAGSANDLAVAGAR